MAGLSTVITLKGFPASVHVQSLTSFSRQIFGRDRWLFVGLRGGQVGGRVNCPNAGCCLSFRFGFLGGDFGAELPRREGSGGKAFCSTKTHLAGPQNRRCPYPKHLQSIHASVREGIAR